MPDGKVLLTWNAMSNNARDDLGFQGGIHTWRVLLEGNPAQLGPFFNAANEAEKNRREASLADLEVGEFEGGTHNPLYDSAVAAAVYHHLVK